MSWNDCPICGEEMVLEKPILNLNKNETDCLKCIKQHYSILVLKFIGSDDEYTFQEQVSIPPYFLIRSSNDGWLLWDGAHGKWLNGLIPNINISKITKKKITKILTLI